MLGKFAGVIAVVALFGALLFVAAPGEAAENECGPVTLDMLFPGLDVHGEPLPTTTTTTTAAPTETTVAGDDATTSTGDPNETTTTTLPVPEPDEGATTTTAPGTPRPRVVCTTWVYEMQWPLAVEGSVFSGFGVDRDGGSRRHKGNDIVAKKLAPVVAVADGTITSVHSTPPDDCCWLLITHEDGWQSLYVHLNNDTFLTDDGLGYGVRPGLEVGTSVNAGDVIGWVGDSGNAELSVPHLHFELRHPNGYPVDPFASLKAAKAVSDLPAAAGPYLDTDGVATGVLASRLLTNGIFWPCDDRGLEFCATRLAQPEDVAELILQMTGLASPLVDAREKLISLRQTVPADHLADILGCLSVDSCLESGITAGDVARLALWANLAMREELTTEDFNPLEELALTDAKHAETGLRVLGIIGICHEGIDADRFVNRGDVASLLSWWILGEGTDCIQSDEFTS